MPEPARLDGNAMGTAPDAPREILIEGEERVAKTHDPLLSSGDQLSKDQLQNVVSERNQTDSLASNVSEATNEADKSALHNIDGGGSASPAPPASGDTEFSPDAAQRASDLDHLSVASPLTVETPDHPTEDLIGTEPPAAVDHSVMSDSAAPTFDGIDPSAMVQTETITDFDWTEHFDDVELPDLGPLPGFDDIDLSAPSDPEAPY